MKERMRLALMLGTFAFLAYGALSIVKGLDGLVR